jgi:putative hydrolase of the HAD superfamily
MGLSTAACLYVGNDMLNDIYPAKQLGFQTALFAGDKRSLRLRTDDARCVNLFADLVLTDLGQLIDHIA